MSDILAQHGPRPLESAASRRAAWLAALGFPAVIGPIWVALLARFGAPLATGSGLILVFLLSVASYTDLRWRRIPNWATYPAALWGVALSAAPAALRPLLGGIGLAESLVGLCAGFAAMFVIYHLAGAGAGDVKLAAALGTLLGPQQVLVILFWCYLLAGASALVVAAWTCGPLRLIGLLLRRIVAVLLPGRVAAPSQEDQQLLHAPMPLAAFFALGTALALSGILS